MSLRYRVFRRMLIYLSRLLFGFTVHGAEKVPKKGPLILASNHHQYADPVLVCMAVPRRIQWMAKREVFVPPLDRFFYFIGSFPVDRQKGGRAALRAALGFLSEGWTLGIFPEGGRRKGGAPGEDAPKSGVAMLASRADAPILPVFVDRAPNPLERLRGHKLHVYVGDPIISDGSTSKERRVRREVAGEVLRAIYDLKNEKPGVAP
ncbi:MAG: Acyl-CoA:1-acyl-sn-glycerol-3-phosphate acyltransferase [uncultured Rubrobacteraceae bacterium]|uniref:Acyl-CoA:1-acyl-sn-glycerol-3-phosphate acyltransferase n=1 Tax=uncultured Rubrobacteraceae bacterium TaxID=349277 RepID=A0A6J4QNL4_9ACTN|nr:MAG: Acyl-CoA:1-acyl-sn-glycerol-3-phosphate acyltransferase [uncultured Rubrobacteraceae bacterium]